MRQDTDSWHANKSFSSSIFSLFCLFSRGGEWGLFVCLLLFCFWTFFLNNKSEYHINMMSTLCEKLATKSYCKTRWMCFDPLPAYQIQLKVHDKQQRKVYNK